MKGNAAMSRTQDQVTHPPQAVYAGVDVGKSHLDFAIHPLGITREVDNDPRGIRTLIRDCIDHDVRRVALEATNKYHRLAHETMHRAGIAVTVVNPFRSRQFADTMGKLAKTDTIDANLLARFAELIRPEPTIPPSEDQKALRELLTARRQLLEEIGDLKRKLHTTQHALAERQIRARIKMAERHKAALETDVQSLIRAKPDLRHRFSILTSIPNIGPVTDAILIADLVELGQVNAKQVAALAGVAPMSWDSGSKQGNRIIRGGRKTVRNALYMCAVGCASRPGAMGSFYRGLIKRGKHPKTALAAVMRKLVILANTLVAQNRSWQPVGP